MEITAFLAFFRAKTVVKSHNYFALWQYHFFKKCCLEYFGNQTHNIRSKLLILAPLRKIIRLVSSECIWKIDFFFLQTSEFLALTSIFSCQLIEFLNRQVDDARNNFNWYLLCQCHLKLNNLNVFRWCHQRHCTRFF